MESGQMDTKKWLRIGIVVYAAVILLILAFANTEKINLWIAEVLRIFRPVINGLIIAYLCNPFFRFYERRVFCHFPAQGARRPLSLLCAFVTFFALWALLLLLILPQLLESITGLIANYETYIASAVMHINSLFDSINRFFLQLTQLGPLLIPLDEGEVMVRISSLLGLGEGGFLAALKNANLESLASVFGNLISALTDSILGLFIAIYLLASKEKRAAQLMKLRRAMFSDRINRYITSVLQIAHRSFGRFLVGKIFDSIIVALLTYVILTLLRVPYALLISAIIGVTNIIPLIGPLIGAIPSALIILLAEPQKTIWFLLVVILIQQIDSNIISPKILGSNIGISSLCVIIAISFMGRVWGFVGMFLCVPIFATILELSQLHVIDRLQKKGLPSDLANYYAPDTVVDPIEDTKRQSERMVRAIEREYLRALQQINSGEAAPSGRQRFFYHLYRLGRKLRLFAEIDTETMVQFSAEKAVHSATAISDLMYRAYLEKEPDHIEPTAPDADTAEGT